MRRKERLKLTSDLSRDYKEAVVKFGPVAARIDFYGQVGISLWPVIRRIFVRAGVIIGVAKLLSWLLGIVVKSFGGGTF